MKIKRLDSSAAAFDREFRALLRGDEDADANISATVAAIIADVKRRGGEALLEYTRRFDGHEASAQQLEIPAAAMRQALDGLDAELREALQYAADRIRTYHEKQITSSWRYEDQTGNRLGQQVTALDKVGIYVPGGAAAYPSSVLMNAIPARLAGVPEIIMVTPTPGGERNRTVLAAAAIAEVDRVFAVGGAQAIAALTYGAASIPPVDKIVGPGNIYVAAAKRQVFGKVGIDMIAGPSEVLIISDGSGDPDWVAMDLFAQAEHDEQARAMLLCPRCDFLESVAESIDRLLPEMERRAIIAKALDDNGALILTTDLDEAVALANRVAPEHLELAVADPEALLPQIRHAGAIFMGHYSAEVFGDYCAGPNHVLPTAGTARFSSPLGVYDFQKRSSVIECSERSAATLSRQAALLARSEDLTAHARSAEYRLKGR